MKFSGCKTIALNSARRLFLGATVVFSGWAFGQAPVKIGFIGELSGIYGAVGQDQFDGFMLVVNANNGRLGGVPVEVIKEDTQFKPDLAGQVVDRLIDRDGVKIITGVSYTNIMLAVAKRITDKEVFLIASNTGPAPLAGERCSPFLFTTTWQNDQLSEVVGQYAREKGYSRIFALTSNYQAGKDFMEGFKRAYQRPLLNEVYTPLTQQDFSAELAQIQAAKPDAVYVFYPGGAGVNFVKQYAQAGMRSIPLLNTATTEGLNLPAQGEAALGATTGSHWGPDFNNAANRKFVADFEAKYKRIPSQYAAQAYDSALLIASALAKTKGNVGDKKAFQAALKAADFQSVRGAFRFGNNNFPIQDFSIFEVHRDAQNRMNIKTVATPMKNVQDRYASLCKMQ